ncbi:MAG: DUF3024 domain-containing protein [Bacteroidetes bacterium]|nr:DUF3024 domain-containing protein [Bacteroidota bacterium]
MPVDSLQTLAIIEVMENFLAEKRPPENIRTELDIGYKIEGQSVFIFEIRPQWDNKSVIQEHAIAKATYVKSKGNWKVFWMRANLRWYPFDPKPTVKKLADFVRLVDQDEYGCFWG